MFLYIDLAGQGPAPVPLAGVLALLAPGAEEPRVETEVGAKPRLLQLPLAVEIQEDGNIHILNPGRGDYLTCVLTSHLECVLISPIRAKHILTPAANKASTTSKPLEDDWVEIKILYLFNAITNLCMVRKTDCSNVIILFDLN